MDIEKRVVGLSGPTGAGKDYLSIAARERLSLKFVTQVTTRPARPKGAENKKPVSEVQYQSYLEKGLLVGHHVEPSPGGDLNYGYLLKDIQRATPTILELNPLTATHIIEELRSTGIEFVGWIGLVADENYLIHNINRRQQMTEPELQNRLRLSRDFMTTLRQRHSQGIVTHLYEVGWHNRETMAEEFTQMVKDILKV